MSEFTSLTSGQMRAARALLRWSAVDLAEKSSLGIATVQRAEASDGVPSMTRANMAAIRRALEAAGVEFIPENGGGAGVRLRKHVLLGNDSRYRYRPMRTDKRVRGPDMTPGMFPSWNRSPPLIIFHRKCACIVGIKRIADQERKRRIGEFEFLVVAVLAEQFV